ncbi:MAG: putative cation transporting ATPase [Anaerocolumna sp.]|nr:putative cation transporting ATPase [Anaerocolumna sp.]
MISQLRQGINRTVLFLLLSLPALILSFFHIGRLPIGNLTIDPAWIAILLCGIPIIKGAIAGLISDFDIKADVLVSIALIASILIGEIFAAGEIAFIMAIGAYLEESTVAKARAGIEKLVHLTPTTARVINNNQEYILPAEQVKIGDILRVLAGETIAVDGVILKGNTSINQAVLTGESLPVDKGEGDEIYSGTVNQFGSFEMIAKKVGEDSSLQRMVRLVESSDASKAKIVGIADQFATWVVIIALLSAAITWLVTGEIIRSVTILVVFCPCALILATPTAIIAGIGNATKFGILIREGDALERLAQVKCIAFDKTGTLTYGKPTLTQVHSIDPQMDEQALLSLAAIVELRSEHPLGKAIVAGYYKNQGMPLLQPDEFRLIPGRGVIASLTGDEILAGNEALMEDYKIILPAELLQPADKAKSNGSTVIYLAKNLVPIGLIALTDILRPDVSRTLEAIHKSNVRTVLLTGDSKPAATYIAETAGILNLRANCLPENKLEEILAYQNNSEPVCMVGDGINDAPALKIAHVGIAMGGIGSDIAIEAADIVLVGDDIKEIPHLLQLAKKTMKTIRVNLIASMLLNFVAIILAITGSINPVIGALVHNVGSVAVIINSSLLLKWRE